MKIEEIKEMIGDLPSCEWRSVRNGFYAGVNFVFKDTTKDFGIEINGHGKWVDPLRNFFAVSHELVAQLLKMLEVANEKLDKLSKLGNGDRPGNSEGNIIAQEALTEMKRLEDE